MNFLARLRTACMIAALAAPACAIAASFDCAKAAGATERAICGSPRLSALDERMARTYERALHALSPDGASRLKASQRSWLRLVTGACGRPAGATATADTRWLEQEFERRAGEIDQAGIRLGPYLLNRVDHYDCTRGDPLDAADASGGIATTHLAWPQIDAPRTPATLAWNAARARDEDRSTAAGVDADTDEGADYEIGCVGPRIVSLRVITSEYHHGSPHGQWSYEVRNSVGPALRDLRADDLFAPASAWKDALPELFWQAYRHMDDANRPLPEPPEAEAAIRAAAVDPKRWLLTPAGLQIAFDAYQLGCYACGSRPVTVPWAALATLLAAPEAAVCKAPPAARP